jgi:beta-lactamase superfamily II metal-dependent hydrolase
MPKSKTQAINIKNYEGYREFINQYFNPRLKNDSISEKIKIVNLSVRKLEEMLQYFTDQKDAIKNIFIPERINLREETRRINNQKLILEQKLTELKASRDKELNAAARVIVPSSDGEYAGNGKCYIQFVNVGHGDCTLVTTPSGRRIMIDLGSDALSDVNPDNTLAGTDLEIIRNNITSKLFLNGDDTIDMLLLTHPDTDHYDKLVEVLDPVVKKINWVYYGGCINFDSFKVANTSGEIKRLTGNTGIKLVVLREEENLVQGNVIITKLLNNTVPSTTPSFNKMGAEFVDAGTGNIVLYCEEKNGSEVFRISILAANVYGVWVKDQFVKNEKEIKDPDEMGETSGDTNRGSLVILVESNNHKVLVMGDATTITEQFVLNHFTGLVKDVQTLRIGHHGSPTSSARKFINSFTNLKLITASAAGKLTTGCRLPKRRIIEQITSLNLPAAAEHVIYAHDRPSEGSSAIQTVTTGKKLYATGSNGSISFAIDKMTTKVFLQNRLVEEHLNITKAELYHIIKNQTENISLSAETSSQAVSEE